ncbi:ARM repeat-containing protein [Tothia fuscella]|uniref:Pumilio homology domain family member 3 n=1 Tax=Tothia fuscella TaxID=1048955 RepID=A0A9P4NLT9_9PEZI|nr:ARM repeat-containing protein [Tothia fuscella]
MGKPWDSSNIWAEFPNATRESSRTRGNLSSILLARLILNFSIETGAFGSAKEVIEGKTGSGSLVPSSDTEWRTSPWETKTSSGSHLRSSGVSPVRRGSSQLNNTHPLLNGPQHSSQYYNNTRASNTVGNKPINGTYESMALGPRQSETTMNGYGHFSRSSDESSRPQETIGSWTDAGSVHSPTDDRRSVTNSEYFGASSAGASRSGSLPPSRHGNEHTQYTPPIDPRYTQAQPQISGHHPSFSSLSNGRFPQERQNSQHSDSLPGAFGRMSLESNADQAMILHRNGSGSQTSHQDAQFLRRQPEYEEVLNGAGPFNPPKGYPSAFQNAEPFRFHQNERSTFTPGANEFRQQPHFYSTGNTPPVFDTMYSSRIEPTRPYNNAHPAILDRKLQRLQQEQQYPYIPHAHYQNSMVVPHRGQFNPYASQYQMPPPMPMNGVHAGALIHQPMHSMQMVPSGMYGAMVEAPRGPRELETAAMASSQLIEFRASSKGNRRWELKDVYGYVVEFSGDQHGSRFIQQKLETANSDEKQIIFKELCGNALQLMTDVFGNYVIQKFFEHGDQNQKKMLASKMMGKVSDLSLQMYGCRVVQKALEHVLTDQQASLIRELDQNVLKCVKDQNGNHVVQKAIERVPMEHIQFIINAFEGKVGELAIHSYGCRVIQRVLEHCDEHAKRSVLKELHAVGSPLISDQYGNYVTQHIIEYGFPEDRARVIYAVTQNLLSFSKHKFASNVVEQCIVFGSPEQKRDIMHAILQKDERQSMTPLVPRTGGESILSQLIKDSYGNYVIQKLLEKLQGEDYKTCLQYVQPEMVKAKRTVAGKQIQAVEKKMLRMDTPNNAFRAIEAAPTTASSKTDGLNSLHSNSSTPIPHISLPPGPPTPDSRTPRAPPLVATPNMNFTSNH